MILTLSNLERVRFVLYKVVRIAFHSFFYLTKKSKKEIEEKLNDLISNYQNFLKPQKKESATHMFLYVFPELVRKNGLEGSLPFLDIYYKFFPSPEVRFMKDLATYYKNKRGLLIEKASENSCTNKKVMAPLFINISMWGKEYSNTFLKYMAPSLLAKGNLPEISKTRQIFLQLFCDEEVSTTIKNSSIFQELSIYSTPTLHIINQELFFNQKKMVSHHCKQNAKYFIYGITQSLGAQEAIARKGYISFLNSDTPLAQNALSTSIKFMEKGKIGVFTNSFRCNLDSIKADLESYFTKDRKSLEIPPNDFSYLQIKHIHPSALRRVVSRKTEYFNACPQLLFFNRKELVSRSLHYHPFMISHKLLDKFKLDTCFPLDGEIPTLIGNAKELFESIEVVEESRTVGIFELSSSETEPPNKFLPAFNTYPQLKMTVQNFLQKRELSAGERYFFSKRTRYISNHEGMQKELERLFTDAICDDKFLSELS